MKLRQAGDVRCTGGWRTLRMVKVMVMVKEMVMMIVCNTPVLIIGTGDHGANSLLANFGEITDF